MSITHGGNGTRAYPPVHLLCERPAQDRTDGIAECDNDADDALKLTSATEVRVSLVSFDQGRDKGDQATMHRYWYVKKETLTALAS